jgi:tRNA 5-methylaminomethyl-2-thiouridine biosynthesis bifunctional protein
VIGGGVAGGLLAHCAHRHGLSVTQFDAADPSRASANQAALVMPRLDNDDTPLARFYRTAFAHAVQLYERLGACWWPCGVTLRARDRTQAARYRVLADAQALPKDGWMEFRDGDLWFARAGVVSPEKLLTHLHRDTVQRAERIGSIRHDGGQWQLATLAGSELGGFDAVVLAGGMAGAELHPMLENALTARLGQVEWSSTLHLSHAVADGHYVAPLPGGGIIFGATHDPWKAGSSVQPSGDARLRNLEALRQLAPAIGTEIEENELHSEAGVRATTPDRHPMAGPLGDVNSLSRWAASLAKGQMPAGQCPALQPGLFTLTGLGSRGFVTAPLLAEAVIADMLDLPSPLEEEARQALHPARFVYRAIKRGK